MSSNPDYSSTWEKRFFYNTIFLFPNFLIKGPTVCPQIRLERAMSMCSTRGLNEDLQRNEKEGRALARSLEKWDFPGKNRVGAHWNGGSAPLFTERGRNGDRYGFKSCLGFWRGLKIIPLSSRKSALPLRLNEIWAQSGHSLNSSHLALLFLGRHMVRVLCVGVRLCSSTWGYAFFPPFLASSLPSSPISPSLSLHPSLPSFFPSSFQFGWCWICQWSEAGSLYRWLCHVSQGRVSGSPSQALTKSSDQLHLLHDRPHCLCVPGSGLQTK